MQKPHWKAVALAERLLERVQRVAVGEAFDGRDVGAVGLDGEHQARPDGFAVDEHGARAAHAVLAPEVGAGQLEILAQEVGERHPDFGVRPSGARR